MLSGEQEEFYVFVGGLYTGFQSSGDVIHGWVWFQVPTASSPQLLNTQRPYFLESRVKQYAIGYSAGFQSLKSNAPN
ncbi:hypothetical protein SUGI_1085650 [Cryptomeria japonica]|nr:hypothetical protein SUGI_1085650 [Cryptomeria japonica]